MDDQTSMSRPNHFGGESVAREDVAHARTSDPDTSHAAAKSVGVTTEKQAAVLRVLGYIGYPVTDEFLIQRYEMTRDRALLREWVPPKQSPSGIRTRRNELVKKGLVKKGAEKKPISTGRLANTWEKV